jgi:hypothetical protein
MCEYVCVSAYACGWVYVCVYACGGVWVGCMSTIRSEMRIYILTVNTHIHTHTHTRAHTHQYVQRDRKDRSAMVSLPPARNSLPSATRASHFANRAGRISVA